MRVHVPSYLVPGTWLENIRVAEKLDWVSGVELLFFSYDEDARGIFAREAGAIADFADRFRFSLHLPDPLTSADEALVEAAMPFVRSYVLHPPRESAELDAWARLVQGLRTRYGRVFYLEYTGRDAFAAAERRLGDMEVCADSGRILLDGDRPARWLAKMSGRVRELHLHGVSGTKDHAPLRPEAPWLREIAAGLVDFPGILELEVFSLEGAEESYRVLASTVEELREVGA